MDIATVHHLQAGLRGRRLELGETQAAIARRAGVSRKWLSDFERGATSAVELPIVLRVAAALGLTLRLEPDRYPGSGQPSSAAESERDEPMVEDGSTPSPSRDADHLDLDALLDEYRERGHD